MIQLIGFFLILYSMTLLFAIQVSGSPFLLVIAIPAYLVGCYEIFVKPIEPIMWE